MASQSTRKRRRISQSSNDGKTSGHEAFYAACPEADWPQNDLQLLRFYGHGADMEEYASDLQTLPLHLLPEAAATSTFEELRLVINGYLPDPYLRGFGPEQVALMHVLGVWALYVLDAEGKWIWKHRTVAWPALWEYDEPVFCKKLWPPELFTNERTTVYVMLTFSQKSKSIRLMQQFLAISLRSHPQVPWITIRQNCTQPHTAVQNLRITMCFSSFQTRETHIRACGRTFRYSRKLYHSSNASSKLVSRKANKKSSNCRGYMKMCGRSSLRFSLRWSQRTDFEH